MPRDPCTSCDNRVPTGDDGLCAACRAVQEGEFETREEYFAEIGRKGGKNSKRRTTNAGLLDPDELPPLDSFEAAETWLDLAGRAVATGRPTDRRAQAVIRAVSEFRDLRSERLSQEELEALRERVEEITDELEQDESQQPW